MIDLFRAIGSQDMARAAEISKQVAATEGTRGHHRVKRDLLGALNGASSSLQSKDSRVNGMAWSIEGTLMPIVSQRQLSALELSKQTRTSIEELLLEWEFRSKLADAGIPRRWRLLFHGPPGCGKSAAAAAIAHATGLPGYLVRFDALIGAYLGQTALRLRELFAYAEHNPCVLLFDEVDALAKKRGNPMDVGELDRVVIAFMQELEHVKGQGFIVATSNLPQLLDDALWRRFDLRVGFPKPKATVLSAFVRRRCNEFGVVASKAILAQAKKVPSFSEAEQIVLNEVRRKVLRD